MRFNNILIIDDDEDDQEFFVCAAGEVCKEANCTIMSNGHEALLQLIQRSLKPDVIFLDLNMPIMNGEQFLIEIKKNKQLQNIPVIILSTSAHIPTISLMKELGAHDFITKPDRYDKLVDILKPLLIVD